MIGPRPMPSADTPAQTPIALPRSAGSVKTFVMIDSVDGMMNAPPMPMSERAAISMLAGVGERRQRRADAEDGEPAGQRPVAAEAVAEAARGEQQAGEHDDVRVDDPLQLAGRRAQAALVGAVRQRRQRDVQDRVVERDHDEADAQHQQREPPPAVGDLGVTEGVSHGVISRRLRIGTQPSRICRFSHGPWSQPHPAGPDAPGQTGP